MILPVRSVSYELFSLVLSVLSIALLTVMTFARINDQTMAALDYADNIVCALFFADFIYSFSTAKKKASYFFSWGWIYLISSIPSLGILRYGRFARVVRVVRVLRGLKSARIISREILKRRKESLFLSAVLLSVVFVFIGAIGVLQFEDDPGSNIKTAGDAIWWAVVTITTVGYGDRFPVTTEGRIVAGFLMSVGVGLFGVVAGFVASWFIEPIEKEEVQDIELLIREVRELRKEVASITKSEKQITT